MPLHELSCTYSILVSLYSQFVLYLQVSYNINRLTSTQLPVVVEDSHIGLKTLQRTVHQHVIARQLDNWLIVDKLILVSI